MERDLPEPVVCQITPMRRSGRVGATRSDSFEALDKP